MTGHEETSLFATTSRGLDRLSFPMRLFEKAKRLGIWNPSDINMEQDCLDWQRMSPEEKDIILRLTSLFQGGEEAVTLDLLPLIQTIASQGRIEEELFLTSFLFEEAKHTDFFSRFLLEVCAAPPDLSHYHTASYKVVFHQALPQALHRLREDASDEALLKASVTYNLIVEGVLAETGYHAFAVMLEREAIFPGLRKGIQLLKQDESRHIAYGVYLLSRLIAQQPTVWQTLEETMNALLVPAMGVISEVFESYEVMPLGIEEQDFIQYAMDQFQKRLERLEKSRSIRLEELESQPVEE